MNLQKIIIVGTSSGAHEVYHKLNRHPELGFEMVGFIGKATATAPRGVPILGDFSQVAEIVRKHDIQKLIIALEENFSYPVVDNNEVISVKNF